MTIVDTLAHGAVDVVVVVSRWFGGKTTCKQLVALFIALTSGLGRYHARSSAL